MRRHDAGRGAGRLSMQQRIKCTAVLECADLLQVLAFEKHPSPGARIEPGRAEHRGADHAP
jgi:hypothetical protein